MLVNRDLSDLQFFVAVVKHGGFSAAAAATNVQKAQISRRVSRLEASIGVKLLKRTTRNVGLTLAGQTYYEHACRALDEMSLARTSVLGMVSEPSGTVRLAAPIFIAQHYLPKLLKEFMRRYPKVSVELEATDRPIDLIKERVDVIIRVRRSVEDSLDAVAAELIRVKRIVVASKTFASTHIIPTSLEVLSEIPTIAYSSDRARGKPSWRLSKNGSDFVEYQITPRLVCNDMRSQVVSAMAGLGAALLPDVIANPMIKNGDLVQLLPNMFAQEQIVHLMFMPPYTLPASARHMVDFLKGSLPGEIENLTLFD